MGWGGGCVVKGFLPFALPPFRPFPLFFSMEKPDVKVITELLH